MIHLNKQTKPVKIWIVQAWNQEGIVFQERAFRYKCEAEQFWRYCMAIEDMNAEFHESMLY